MYVVLMWVLRSADNEIDYNWSSIAIQWPLSFTMEGFVFARARRQDVRNVYVRYVKYPLKFSSIHLIKQVPCLMLR